MAWDSTKSTAADPDSPTADEQNPASEWNEMITYLKARVGNTLFDAYSILYADVDDTPAALTVAASRIVGRKATGGIVAMTGAEAAALLTGLAASGANSDITSLASLTTPLSITQGGTGVTGDTYDADKVDGCHAGIAGANVYKIPTLSGHAGQCVKVNAGATALELGVCGGGQAIVASTYIVAATIANGCEDPLRADQQCDGTADQTEINTVITALPT